MEINDEYLTKVRSEFIWCRGDIYKRNINGNDILVEKDVLFQYDTANNNFLKEEELIGTYADFRGYETGAPENSDVKIPLSELEFFKESPELLNNDFYLTIRDRESSHIEGSKKKTQNYENHLDMFARIAGFKKIG